MAYTSTSETLPPEIMSMIWASAIETGVEEAREFSRKVLICYHVEECKGRSMRDLAIPPKHSSIRF
jgi:hypothetical protein